MTSEVGSRLGAAVPSPEPRRLGPGASLAETYFEIDGERFARRAFPVERALEPIDRSRRARQDEWRSQLDQVAGPSTLAAAVPSEDEVFTYISPTMARVLLRMARVDASEHGGFILLFGPTGCGKTTTAKTFCWLANQPVTELAFSGDTTLTDFYRSVEVVRSGGGQSTVTALGPAVEAMLTGRTLLINEINMLPPDILVIFSQAMDTGRLIVSGTERGNVEIEVHRDFKIIGTANPNYVGTLEMGRAMERRFGRGLGYIEMTYIPPEEEAAAVANEFNRYPRFREAGITVDVEICHRLAELAHRLRNDEQIGNVLRDRLSTRALVHWLGLAHLTGVPLADVAERALLTTVPRDGRARAVDVIRDALGGERFTGSEDGRARLTSPWPEVTPDQAIPVTSVRATRRRVLPANGIVVHRVRYQRVLPDGTRVLIGEPFYRHDGQRVGLGLRLRAYTPAKRQITDPERLRELEMALRDQYGVNVPWRAGRPPALRDALPCLTESSIRALQLAEAALVQGRPVFLAGPTGCGKSSLARTLAYLHGKRLVEFSFTGETAKGDLTASRRLVGGVTRWTTQAFMESLARGDAILVNDYNMAYPDVHSLINGVFDKGSRFELPDGTVCQLHPETWVIAAGSLEGAGVKPLNEGVENRFGAIIGMDYPPVVEELAILRAVAPHLASAPILASAVNLTDFCRRLATGRTSPDVVVGLSRAAQEALRQAARAAALSTAELVALAHASRDAADFGQRFRSGVLEGTPDAGRRVLEPVLLQYGVD